MCCLLCSPAAACLITAHNITFSHIQNFLRCKTLQDFSSVVHLKVKSMTNAICQSQIRRPVLTICTPKFGLIDLLIEATAEAINTSMLLQQTAASKHIELAYFQASRRQVLLPQKEKSDKGRQGLFIFTFFMLKTTRRD